MIRDIGTAARQRLSELTEQPVHLKLFVRVTERWRNMPRQLAEMGYTPPNS
jgi:GTPase Era involved in 16S rRNA processing